MVAVTPVQVHYDPMDFEPFMRTEQVLNLLWRESSWPVLGPREFRVLDPSGKDLLRATDFVLKAKAMGADPHRFGLLRLRVSRREGQYQARVIGKGGGVGGDYQGEMVATATLIDVHSEIIAEVEVTEAIDPFADRPGYDAHPECRAALAKAVRSVLAACVDCVERAPRMPLEARASPAVLLGAADTKGTLLRDRLAKANALDRDQLLWQAMQSLQPEISLPRAQALAKQPPGFCMPEVDAPAPFVNGDCVIAVNGQAIDSPHALARAMQKGVAARLKVIGANGEEREVKLDYGTDDR